MCGGKIKAGTTTFTVDLKSGVVLVRDVPAHVCQQCGEDFIDAKTASQLEKITSRARGANFQLEMVSMA